MRIGLFPFVVAAAAGSLALLVVGVFRLFRGGRAPGWSSVLLVLLPLAVVDGIVCLYFVVSAGLSHSAAAIKAAPLKCLAATGVLVVLPAAALAVARLVRSRGPGDPTPPPA